MIRIFAIVVLLIPGVIAALGIKLMRDTLFDEVYSVFMHTMIQFAAGFLLFIAGIGFIAGFVVHRDRKRQQKKKDEK
ncbi:DUF2627 domain-containing protein [Virgibacillus xinjiangensis]|uniref:DUF2627 domain-containing protein n=1 Tax=Virgibacillus xinjiangensis TaxID=393090 RepID=A0ABV7CRY5_9BACI